MIFETNKACHFVSKCLQEVLKWQSRYQRSAVNQNPAQSCGDIKLQKQNVRLKDNLFK